MDWQLVASYFTVKSTDIIFYSVARHVCLRIQLQNIGALFGTPVPVSVSSLLSYDCMQVFSSATDTIIVAFS